MGSSVETFQLSIEQAELYEATFVPVLFAPWADEILAAAHPAPGESLLDVACGTGVVARGAIELVGPTGRVVGLDLNDGMLAVARRLRPDVEWRQGDAAALPFEDGSFDVVVCQAALMFFPDRAGALREMARVVTAEGAVAVLVPGRLEASAAYARFVEVASHHAGPEAIDLLSTYFVLGDLDELRGLFDRAGLDVTGTRTMLTTVAIGSVDDFVTTEVEGSPLIERIDEDVYRRIREDARLALAPFIAASGRLEGPIEAHVVTARRR
jgi:ubiquinone/menaquinone biosynthesis C-methylase UbiE